ncbi:Testis-expressed protein 11 [Amphibalanus amphitrite]|uniref:Protein ZIP4 homolog n=1 Tax=Amphibalanus amphitrite TaxID=1232801 RepID=A0A6A4X255_AMPAM|nr:Testis-expressed protein 11 [Amphibalanus amphitrite]
MDGCESPVPPGMEEDAESLVLPALQRCVDELAVVGGAEPSAVLERLQEHLCPALGIPPRSDAAELGQLLVCRLWNLPLRESLGQLTTRLSRRLAAELLLLLAGSAPLPVANATQVLLTAARQCLADGELSRALSLSELALRDLLLRRAAAESQLATFARRADTLRQLAAIEQARFGCLMVRAEALFLREEWQAVDETVREAGGARDASGDQLRYMQRLMFNFGLSRYRQRDWTQAARWLNSSMEVGQGLARSHGPSELRARTLDLLARTHLQAGSAADLRRATQLLQLGFSETPSLTARLLILSCELRRRAAGDPEQPAGTVEHCVRDAADWCRRPAELVRLADLLVQHQCGAQAVPVLRRAAADGWSGDACRRAVHLLLRLERPAEALKALSEYCAQPEHTKDGQTVVGQVAALEERADALMEAGERESAVQLLEKLADLPGVEPETAARLLRNVARCRRDAGELEAAEAALRRSLQLQPGCPAALYLLLQLLLAAGRQQDALQLLPAIDAAPDRTAVARLWRHLCAFSLGRQMAGLYERLLEAAARHLDRAEDCLPLAQCLVRCRIETLETQPVDEGAAEPPDVGPLLAALEMALVTLQRSQVSGGPVADGSAAARWLSDVSWNVAVHGGRDMAPADRGRLFNLCRLFLQAGPGPCQDPAGLALCRTAATMAAAAALEASRQPALTLQEKRAHLGEVLDCVEECRALTSRLGGSSAGWTDRSDVLLYQLEAKAGLGAPELPGLVSASVCDIVSVSDCVSLWCGQAGLGAPELPGLVSALIHRPDSEPATLEAAAALLGSCRPELTARALRAAADLLLRAPQVDWSRVAALQTRYTSLMLDHVDAPELPADRALAAVLAVRDSIRRSEGRYPNMTGSNTEVSTMAAEISYPGH